jgi:rhodanese-related sulfurtransferase
MLQYAPFLAHPFEVGMSRKDTRISHISSESASRRKNKIHKRNLAWLWIGLGVLLVAVVGILLIRPKNTPSVSITSTQANTSSVEITPVQAYAKYQQGIFFLDVRTQDEWNQIHLAKSTLIPLDQLPSRLSELPKDQEIVVICLSGHRSQSAVAIMQQAGFARVAYMSGGLQAWMAAGYPVQRGMP